MVPLLDKVMAGLQCLSAQKVAENESVDRTWPHDWLKEKLKVMRDRSTVSVQ